MGHQYRTAGLFGWVAERFKAPVLKTGVLSRVPWVQIPPHPLSFYPAFIGLKCSLSTLDLVPWNLRVDRQTPVINSPCHTLGAAEPELSKTHRGSETTASMMTMDNDSLAAVRF